MRAGLFFYGCFIGPNEKMNYFCTIVGIIIAIEIIVTDATAIKNILHDDAVRLVCNRDA